MKKITGNIIIAIGLILIAAALALTAFNIWDDRRVARVSEDVVEQLMEKIDPLEAEPEMMQIAETPEMPEVEIDGYSYIGILEIPDCGLCLPVMSECNYTLLRTSPCRYTGSYYTDDLVICAHNYGHHFRPIKYLEMGTDVYFVDLKGNTIHYQVTNRETVEPTAIEEMIENRNNSDSLAEWDMTLFTCNTGGQTRCAVRCERADEE